MIITKKIEIRVAPFTLKYYNDLGYNVKVKDIIEIPVEHLLKGSNVKIRVKCDECGNRKEIKYQTYLKNIEKYNIYTCSQKCCQIKVKKTNLDKYGVEYVLQSKEIQDKVSKTNIERYGVEYPAQSEEIQDKNRQVLLDKYGVEYSWFIPGVKDKIKQICLDNFGVDTPLKSVVIRDKGRKTKKEKYGDEFYTNPDKIAQTKLERYGDKYFTNSKKMVETVTGLPYDKYIEQLPEFKKYKRKIRKITNKQPLYLLKNYDKKGLAGNDGAYHLDHKYSTMLGFVAGIESEIIGNISNLEYIIWEDNLNKSSKCSITKEQLFEGYKKRDNILEKITKEYNKRIY